VENNNDYFRNLYLTTAYSRVSSHGETIERKYNMKKNILTEISSPLIYFLVGNIMRFTFKGYGDVSVPCYSFAE